MAQRVASLRENAFDPSVVRSFDGLRTAEHSNRRTAGRFSPETRAAIQAAEAAGRILLRHFGRVRGIRFKGAKDPVTVADTAAERSIRASLARCFPRIGFLGEEGTAIAGSDGRWIVDPLDGTIAFISGLPFFAVSIALERGGRIEAGAILLPRLDELFVAERGRGRS